MIIPERSGAAEDRTILRGLALKVAEAAADERRMGSIRKRWRDVNALRRPDRAPVWCKPVGLWSEIIPEDSFVCRDPFHREIERFLRQVLGKLDLDDDTPIDRFFPVQAVLDVEPENRWGLDIAFHKSDTKGGAWSYDPPLREAGDFERLRRPAFRYNALETRRRIERVGEIFGDILPPRRVCLPPLVPTFSEASELRGLERMMLDTMDEPELLHRVMAHLRDSNLAALDVLEKAGILSPNHDLPFSPMGPSIYSDPLGAIPPGGAATAANLWCAANSQEFDQISPAMWEEFCLEYQKPVFARSGLVCYGCCENLTRKLDGVLSIPNLRIVVCSAWTDKDILLSRVPADRYAIMWRQKASDICVPDDDRKIRDDLLAGARRFQGRYYQIVLRELETLMGHTGRLHAWVRYAKEAAERYAGMP